jgi:hypothetical protein
MLVACRLPVYPRLRRTMQASMRSRNSGRRNPPTRRPELRASRARESGVLATYPARPGRRTLHSCWAPGHTGNVGAAHTSQPFASERFSPLAPAPAAPPLPAQYAIRRDRADESAPQPRRSRRRSIAVRERSACGNAGRRSVASR